MATKNIRRCAESRLNPLIQRGRNTYLLRVSFRDFWLAQAGSSTDATAAATAELQKAVQNPVANLISVPLQNNSNFGAGPYDRTQDVLNIQPVIPAKISDNWMIMSIMGPLPHRSSKRVL